MVLLKEGTTLSSSANQNSLSISFGDGSDKMHRGLSTDAHQAPLNFPHKCKELHDNLCSRDVKAMKFLCSDFIPLQRMEKVESVLTLLEELRTRCKISPPDRIGLIGELLYCLRHYSLMEKIQFNCEEVHQIVEDGRGQLHPCRVLLHRICEDISDERFSSVRYLCPDISKSTMEKIKDPYDFIHVLERLNLVRVTEQKLSYLREILSTAGLEELLGKIDDFVSRCNRNELSAQNILPSSAISGPAGNQNVPGSAISRPAGNPNVPGSAISRPAGNHNVPGSAISRPAGNPNVPSSAISRPAGNQSFPETNLCVSLRSARTSAEPQTTETLKTFSGNVSEESRVLHAQPEEDSHFVENQKNLNRQVAGTNQDEASSRFYSMTRRPRGICLIINNEVFYRKDPESRVLKYRAGSGKDCALLKKVFGQDLNFSVEVCHDLSDVELVEQIRKTASLDHSNFDCFVCCILSHGVDRAVYGANGKSVPLKQIMAYFRPSQCRSLGGKPKLFFIQACQGSDWQMAFDVEADGPSLGEFIPPLAAAAGIGVKGESIPDEADFLIALSTVPGYVSYRSKTRGSWFITTLVKILESNAKTDDLMSILTDVNCEISREEDCQHGQVFKQVAMPMTTLRKKVKFF